MSWGYSLLLPAAGGGPGGGGGGGGGYAHISHVASASTSYAGNRTSTTVPAPAGIADDDFLLLTLFLGLSVGAGGAPDPSGVPSGFVEIGSVINVTGSGFNGKFRSYYKRASGESGDYAFSHANCSSQGMMQAFRDVDWDSGPFSGVQTANDGTGSTRTWTGLTAATPQTVIAAVGFDWGDAGAALTPPSGMTEVVEVNPLIYAAWQEVAEGATGDRSHTCNTVQAFNPWGARLIGLRPQALAGESIYLGAAGVAALYKGAQGAAALYKGAKGFT